MEIKRPHLIARKTRLPAFKFRRILLFLIFTVMALITGLFGKELVAEIPVLNVLETFMPILAIAFGIAAIVVALIVVVHVIYLNAIVIEFYDAYVIKKSIRMEGLIPHLSKEQSIFPKVLSCHVDQGLLGIMFNYGDVKVDAIGKWDIDLTMVKKPELINTYLNNRFVSKKEVKSMRQTFITQ